LEHARDLGVIELVVLAQQKYRSMIGRELPDLALEDLSQRPPVRRFVGPRVRDRLGVRGCDRDDRAALVALLVEREPGRDRQDPGRQAGCSIGLESSEALENAQKRLLRQILDQRWVRSTAEHPPGEAVHGALVLAKHITARRIIAAPSSRQGQLIDLWP